MIIFRNPLWDSFIEFLDKLREYPPFESIENGRYKNRLDGIYDRVTDNMRIDKSDLDLIAKTFIFLSDKNVDSDLIEYMKECKVLGHKCKSSAEGEKIILECEAAVKERREKQRFEDLLAEKRKKFEEDKAAYDEYMASQNNIVDSYEKSKMEYEQLASQAGEKEEVKEEKVEEIEDDSAEKQETVETEEGKENE